MILNLDNEVDKKIFEFFPEDVIENINPEINDFLGMNITSDSETDIAFKIYYGNKYSKQVYEKLGDDSLVNFLFEKDMISYLGIVHDKNNSKYTRFDIGLQCRNNSNMQDMFSRLEENVSFFGKYKDEILKLSKMKASMMDDYDYSSLFFLGFVKDKTGIKTLKCHWLNKNREGHEIFNDDYFINFIQESGVVKLQELVPYAQSSILNCGRHMWMEGIDYNEKCSEKHKIYIDYPQNFFDGILKSIPENAEFESKINLIRGWHEIHPEFYIDGFAIGKNVKDNLTLNIYFKLKVENN